MQPIQFRQFIVMTAALLLLGLTPLSAQGQATPAAQPDPAAAIRSGVRARSWRRRLAHRLSFTTIGPTNLYLPIEPPSTGRSEVRHFGEKAIMVRQDRAAWTRAAIAAVVFSLSVHTSAGPASTGTSG